jgi:malto-oligosyltrehalose synthase/4-alpha-glucanotransferase
VTYNPVSTLRLQFNKDFSFKRAEELIPFFEDLGVRTIYASPVFKAVPGSMHGYDIVDPLTINPEIGTEGELVNLTKKLDQKNIGWIQDIVPNHMAYDKTNTWLNDVLEKGPRSEFADFFDTSYATDFFHGPLAAPGDPEINYRRFFLINGLICLNMQSQKVFDRYHQLIAKLVYSGIFKGLRVDHVDGLYDPTEYLRRLRLLVGPDVYIVVEKILEPEEDLCKQWPVEGTTGYDFLAVVNNLFTSINARPVFDNIYRTVSPERRSFEDKVASSKRMILKRYMSGELNSLVNYFIHLKLGDVSRVDLHGALAEVMVRCPYYRFYGSQFPLKGEEYTALLKLINDCRLKAPAFEAAFEQLVQALFELPSRFDGEYNRRATKFYMRLMQFTGPLMAKGVEDTLMYTFNRFIGHNEVGDLPNEFGASIGTFHQAMLRRQQDWPFSMNATATHDTKRGEDSRMRLNVLTDIPTEWSDKITHWFAMNTERRSKYPVDPNDEYMIYQSLVATFPGESSDEYVQRVIAFASKALREAKVHTRWEAPNTDYESSVGNFIKEILDSNSDFMQSFRPFLQRVTEHGEVNSLSQLLLKICCPGTPDIYQGSLGWDLSFVDPDNRRPVDYHALPGNKKFELTKKLLKARKDHERIFTLGHYRPLKVTGPRRSNVIAFGREYQGSWIIAAAILHAAQPASVDWENTAIQLPDECCSPARDLINGDKVSHQGSIEVAQMFSKHPVALWLTEIPKRQRRSGILMPVASLPSRFSVGDIGQSARQFADFLFASRQRAWQMLPVNAVDKQSSFSPYSSVSSVAGSSMLISMEDLMREGLLSFDDIDPVRHWKKNGIDYEVADRRKKLLLKKAWTNAMSKNVQDGFQQFLADERPWLDGFAQFSLLQKLHGPLWTTWPEDLRHRDATALARLEQEHAPGLMMIRWTQFIFYRQMKALRRYCNERDIILIGDVPFYIGLNSADVWQHRKVFDIDENGKPKNVAGVPPDYFNSEGQLWGMPVFNWETEPVEVSRWWIQRLRKSMDLFDYVRLDHFRAFSGYWSIPADSRTATTGEWKIGPGLKFFEAAKDVLGDLRLIAEDLGDITPDVYALRDALKLPGMKVLQFGFGPDFPASTHLPHNHSTRYIVYPGTHDNNTTRGWFEHDIGEEEKENISAYFNTRVNKANVAEIFVRSCYASNAETCIVSMPDVLRLGGSARINKPSTTKGNWVWRMNGMPKEEVVERLRTLVHLYER